MMNIARKYRWAIALFLSTFLTVGLLSACSSLIQTQPLEYQPLSPTEGRLITHELGETIVPKEPKRVVVLGVVPDVLALGVQPVGASKILGFAQRDSDRGLPSFLGDRIDGITLVGEIDRPSLEAIVQLEPDLILGAEFVHKGIYQKLTQIAPTVIIDISQIADSWKQSFRTAAEALGRLDAAEALLDEYDRRIDTFQQAMGDRLATTEVSVVRSRPDVFRAYMKGSFSGAVLEDVGVARPAIQTKDKPFENLSLEQIELIDGDALFLMQDNPKNSTLDRVKDNPLWLQLGVVQQGNIYEISLESWFLNPGIVSANLILNDLFRYLVPEGDRYVVRQIGELTIQ